MCIKGLACNNTRNQGMQRAIHVLFLRSSSNDFRINRLTAWLGRLIHGEGFCHVELCVPDVTSSGLDGFVSSSIYNGETVSLNRKKTFSNPGYNVHTISVSQNQLDCILDRVYESHRTCIGFDTAGMVLSTLPFQAIPNSRSSTFCSKYVVEVLQSGGVAQTDGLNPCTTTPSKLYKVLKDCDLRDNSVGIVGTVKFKMDGIKM